MPTTLLHVGDLLVTIGALAERVIPNDCKHALYTNFERNFYHRVFLITEEYFF